MFRFSQNAELATTHLGFCWTWPKKFTKYFILIPLRDDVSFHVHGAECFVLFPLFGLVLYLKVFSSFDATRAFPGISILEIPHKDSMFPLTTAN